MRKVVIIGGGISGLSATYFLQKEAKKRDIKLQYSLIEKNDRLGGNILTDKIDDFIVEGGPDCFLSSKTRAYKLCEELGLSDRLLNTNDGAKTFILWRGKLKSLPEGFILMVPTKFLPFIFGSLISVRGKLRMLLDLVKPKGDTNKDESLSEFVGRRFGNEVVEKIAEPLVAGIHAGEPETMSVKSSFPRFIEMEQKNRSLILALLKARFKAKKGGKEKSKYTMFLTLKGGLVELVGAIIKKLDNASILKDMSVEKIEEEKKDNSYIVTTKSGKSIKADSVVLTTPAYVSAKLLKNIDCSLAEDLKKIPYVSTATVSLAFKESDLKQPLKGFGFVVPRLEKRKIMAATFSSKKFNFRAPKGYVLIRCFIGGSNNEKLVDLKDEELVKIAREELADILGIDAKPVLAKVYKWKKAMPQRIVGHEKIVKSIYKHQSEHPGIFLAGSAYKGVGIADSVHGGEILASEILDKLTNKTNLF